MKVCYCALVWLCMKKIRIHLCACLYVYVCVCACSLYLCLFEGVLSVYLNDCLSFCACLCLSMFVCVIERLFTVEGVCEVEVEWICYCIVD